MVGEFAIGLVNDKQNVIAQAFSQAGSSSDFGDTSSGGIAGIGNKNDAGIRLDRSQQAGNINSEFVFRWQCRSAPRPIVLLS